MDSSRGQLLQAADRGNMNPCVLINDDDSSLTGALASAFLRAGFATLVTNHGSDAMRLIQERRADLLITDLSMPGLSGTELIRQMANLDLFVPVIAISGHVSMEHQRIPFFAKPFHAKNLIEFIREHMGSLKDMQQLKLIAERFGILENELGRVLHFDPRCGWGLLQVVGMDRPLYVNAADIEHTESKQRKRSAFRQLHFGQIVRFKVENLGARGPRAIQVQVVFDDNKPRAKN